MTSLSIALNILWLLRHFFVTFGNVWEFQKLVTKILQFIVLKSLWQSTGILLTISFEWNIFEESRYFARRSKLSKKFINNGQTLKEEVSRIFPELFLRPTYRFVCVISCRVVILNEIYRSEHSKTTKQFSQFIKS